MLLLMPVSLFSQVRINELLASNASVHADLDFREYVDWIELYNYSDEDFDLSGHFLSDDASNPQMWEFQSGTVISARSFLLVYADGTGFGLHTNFSLAREGEKILLLDPLSGIIDSLTYPEQRSDISYGISRDGQSRGYFESPSPGSVNDTELAEGYAPTPVFSKKSGFYPAYISVAINTGDPAVSIHYTTNGKSPKQSDPLYSGPLEIRETTVLRAKAFKEDMLDGFVVTHSYFINEEQNLPVISLATNPANFFSDEYGIYVEGTSGTAGYCTDVPHNVNQDWERAVNIELIEKDGSSGLNQMAGVKIFGGCSRVRYPIKSLAFYARQEYEASSFNYQLFPDKPSDRYENFILRASADDQPFTLFRDPLAQMLVKDVINVDVQAYRPVVVYINGEYWGIHNIREKINEHYAEDNFGVNPDSVDMVKRNPEYEYSVIHGSADHYNNMIQYLEDNDISQDQHYEYINTQMDMDEYLNYQIIQIFFGARDWPGNNIKYWRSREGNFQRWRWVLYDLDHVFKEYFSDIMDEATMEDCQCDWPNPPWSTYLFRRLLENESFKQEFLRRFAIYSTTHFSRDRLHEYIDNMQAELAPEIPRHIERWGGQKSELPDNTWMSPIFSSVEEWEANVDVMRHFADTRHEMAMKQVMNHFGMEALNTLQAKVEPADKGQVLLGGTLISKADFSGEFSQGTHISAEAIPGPGYLFSHWISQDLEQSGTALIASGDQWKYLVSKNTPGADWKDPGFDDGNWESGPSQLGYGEGDEATQIGYGGDPDNKFITSWFRKSIIIEDTTLYSGYMLKLMRDDGVRVFINGTEIVRDNLQRWSTGATATAQSNISGAAEVEWLSFRINPSIFNPGENLFAVEIHQSAPTSSDLSFDLELMALSLEEGPEIRMDENKLSFDLFSGKKLTAIMIPVNEKIENLHINEIMASNVNHLQDEMGEYEDWIEIYNSGEKSIDLAGLFLTDNMQDEEAWVFPTQNPELTSIEAKGFLLVYADNEPLDGPLHANFKLSRSGEEVVLYQMLGEETHIIDQLVFGEQSSDVSFGRFPDAAPRLEFMSFATPTAANTLGTGNGEEDLTAKDDEESVSIYPVPTDGPLHIRFTEKLAREDLPVRIMVHDMSGRLIMDSEHRSSSLISLSLTEQARGLYLVRIISPQQSFVKTAVVH